MDLIIGSHVSFTNKEQLLGSVKESISYGANTFMFYTGGPQSTIRSGINDDLTYEAYKLMIENGINSENVIVHAPYILNLANRSDERKYEFYIDFFADELNRVKRLGFNKIVLHPGSAVSGSREEGINNIIEALNKVFDKTNSVTVLLETMAGKGSEVGSDFSQIQHIISHAKYPERLGVCLDTCHINDAGYDVADIDNVLKEFDKIIGLDKLLVIHVNDTKNPKGAHKDRHENIGYGYLGFETLCNVIHNPLLKGIPMILETPYYEGNPPYKREIEMLRNKTFEDWR